MSNSDPSSTILIVEDDKFLSKALDTKLTRKGFNTITAYNGAEAIEHLEQLIPSVILLDLMMPVKNGFDVLEYIQGKELLQSVPILVVTNLAQSNDEEESRKLGATDFMIKSNTPINTIVDRITELLST